MDSCLPLTHTGRIGLWNGLGEVRQCDPVVAQAGRGCSQHGRVRGVRSCRPTISNCERRS